MLGQHQISTQALWEMQAAIDYNSLLNQYLFRLMLWLTIYCPFYFMFPKETCSYSQLLILLFLNRDDLGLGVISHPTYISVVDLLQVSWLAVASQRSLAGIAKGNWTKVNSRLKPDWKKTYKYICTYKYMCVLYYLHTFTTVSNNLSILGSGQDAFRRSSASWANSLPRSSKKKQLFLLFVYSLQELPATWSPRMSFWKSTKSRNTLRIYIKIHLSWRFPDFVYQDTKV